MNTNILKKCVEELKKESPKIDYVLGMLESVIELSGTNTAYSIATPGYSTITIPGGATGSVGITTGSGLMDLESTTASYVTTPGPIGNLS